MIPQTITPAVGAVCHYKPKPGLRRSPGGLHTRTRLSSLLILNLDSSLNIWFNLAAFQFPREWYKFKRRCQWVVDKAVHDLKYSSANCLRLDREDRGAPCEGAICAWMVTDETVGCTRAFLTMWRPVEGVLSLVFV
ncbi:uncharacterized protein TNCV_3557481 [Trichonephila clavipes]|uniref:Uncharacterized protein n=1 Tax=Trichonephila clavipes TaxID=2585209 RepID=A0A8X6WCC5_TRICX|nr:uncharacterized protein TNCV_3557481 [Trichonephila clavipes]